MMQPLRVPYALEWPDRTCLAQYPIWTPSTLVTVRIEPRLVFTLKCSAQG